MSKIITKTSKKSLVLEEIYRICKAKNGTQKDFNIYQIYHPFLYYHNSNLPFKKIVCVYLVREKSKLQDKNNGDILKLWAYTFSNPKRLDSIQFLQSKAYILTQG